jgi:drug/metabolite transporter (DMT)-like permease
MIEPVLNPVWVLAVTGEKPSAHALAGGGIIIAAIAASSVIGKRREGLERKSLQRKSSRRTQITV